MFFFLYEYVHITSYYSLPTLNNFWLGIFSQLTEADQELYKNFALVISERWQNEVAETVFESVNIETDKLEQKKKAKQKQRFIDDEKGLCTLYSVYSFNFNSSAAIIKFLAIFKSFLVLMNHSL